MSLSLLLYSLISPRLLFYFLSSSSLSLLLTTYCHSSISFLPPTLLLISPSPPHIFPFLCLCVCVFVFNKNNR